MDGMHPGGQNRGVGGTAGTHRRPPTPTPGQGTSSHRRPRAAWALGTGRGTGQRPCQVPRESYGPGPAGWREGGPGCGGSQWGRWGRWAPRRREGLGPRPGDEAIPDHHQEGEKGGARTRTPYGTPTMHTIPREMHLPYYHLFIYDLQTELKIPITLSLTHYILAERKS